MAARLAPTRAPAAEASAIPTGPRPFEVWDLLGVAFVSSVALIFLATGSQWGSGAFSGLAGIGVATGAAGALVSVGEARRRASSSRAAARGLVRAWTHPARDWMLFVFGALLFTPAAALHAPVIGFHSDSSNLQSSIRFVQRNGLRRLVETQEVLLPHLVLGPALWIGGIPGAIAASIASVQALAGTVSYLAWKLGRSATAASGAVLALFAFRSIVERAALLPMYPTMLLFGFLGLYLAHRAIGSSGRRRWTYAVGAGLSIVLSLESHQLGQMFLVLLPALIITARFREAFSGLWRVGVWVGVFYLPRAVINLMEGGVSYFFLNRVDFWVTEGHLVNVQERFFVYPSTYDFPVGYLQEFYARFLRVLPSPLPLVVIGLAILGFFLARGRQRWFAVLAVGLPTGLAMVRQVPAFPRYFSVQVVAAALGAGLTIGLLWRSRRRASRSLAAAVLVFLVVAGWFNYAATVRQHRVAQGEVLSGPLPELAARIDDGRGVIGMRAMQLPWVDDDVRVYGGDFLTEEELVTYATWPSDAAVIEIMERHDIGWALVNPEPLLEIHYNEAWIGPAYGLPIRHVERLAESPHFCLAMERGGYLLYRLGGCG